MRILFGDRSLGVIAHWERLVRCECLKNDEKPAFLFWRHQRKFSRWPHRDATEADPYENSFYWKSGSLLMDALFGFSAVQRSLWKTEDAWTGRWCYILMSKIMTLIKARQPFYPLSKWQYRWRMRLVVAWKAFWFRILTENRYVCRGESLKDLVKTRALSKHIAWAWSGRSVSALT